MELLGVGSLVFIIGLLSVLFNRKNILITLLSTELILLGLIINIVTLSIYFDDIYGIFLAISLLTVAGAESAIGLSLLVPYYRYRGSIVISYINTLHG